MTAVRNNQSRSKKKAGNNIPSFHYSVIASLILFLSIFIYSSSEAQLPYTKYWIQFTDKNNNPFSISSPSQFLSQKAIDRRQKQNISIEENDLPLSPPYVDSILSTGAKILNKSKWFNAVTMQVSDSAMLNKILSFPFVKGKDEVSPLKRRTDFEKKIFFADDAVSGKSYTDDYGAASTQIKLINTDVLHAMGYRGEGMTIAVLDAGFYNADSMAVFDSLRANGQILGTWDFVQQNDSVYEDGSHGAYVLSTMAANVPGMIIGTAPKAKYWLLRSEEEATEYIIEEDNWVAAAEFADSVGADIINSSLGYSEFSDAAMNHTYADMDGNTTRVTIGADIAASKGILVCNSAGNEATGSWKYIIAPADGDSVLAVGAVRPDKTPSVFTSYGPSADGRVKPNVSAQGSSVAVASVASNTVDYYGGTSFSSPITAGSAACLWQAFPGESNMAILHAIEKGADRYENPDERLGYGIANFYNSYLILKEKNENLFDKDRIPFVYPNPFRQNLNLMYYTSVTGETVFEVFDMLGRKVWEKSMQMDLQLTYYKVDLSELKNLSANVYLLRIKNSNSAKSYLMKIIKI